MIAEALSPLATNPDLRAAILDVRKSYEQTIDEGPDSSSHAGFTPEGRAKAAAIVVVPAVHRGEQGRDPRPPGPLQPPLRRAGDLHRDQGAGQGNRATAPAVDPGHALACLRDPRQLEGARLGRRTLTDIVSLVRFALDQDPELIPFRDQVEERFEAWLAIQKQQGVVFTKDQLRWLTWMKESIASDMGIGPDSFEYTPYAEHGGIGKAVQVFGERLTPLIDELTQALAA